MKLRQTMALVAFVAFGCWGCTASKRTESFATVSTAVQERIGKEVIWAPPSEQLGQSIRELLVNDLTADDAVQIALLRNHSLQALYEELSIADADLKIWMPLSKTISARRVDWRQAAATTAWMATRRGTRLILSRCCCMSWATRFIQARTFR